jgi:hypothetical protein
VAVARMARGESEESTEAPADGAAAPAADAGKAE